MKEAGTALAYAPNREQRPEADRDLVVRARSGDHDAFAEIMRAHQRKVYGVALKMTRRHEVADDIAQETFLRAYKSLGRFDLGRPLGPWLTKIAVNLSINYWKGAAGREQAMYTEDSPEGPRDPTADGGPGAHAADPARRLACKELAAALEKALEQLSPEHRAVLVLKVDEGMRYEEIARTLDVSQGTVMSRLFRARAKLKKLLSDHL